MNIRKELSEAFIPPGPKDRESFLMALPFPKLSFGGFILSQIKYIRKRFWAAAVLLLTAAAATVFVLSDTAFAGVYMSEVWLISSMTPFFAILTAAEISRSAVYGMNELESACRFSLPQLTGARTLILGVCGFAVIAAAAVLSGLYSDVGVMKSALYIFAPFLAVNGMSLAFLRRFRGQDGIYASAASAAAVSLAGILAGSAGAQTSEHIVGPLCAAMGILGAAAIIVNIRKITNGEAYYGTDT
ncbi:MAG: hypothetical protein ACI4XF_11960 [Oscillospiraceae bacterium]